jgi:hypothetical protein
MVGDLLDVVGGSLRTDCTHCEVQAFESTWGRCVGFGRFCGIRYLMTRTCRELTHALLIVCVGSDSVSMSLKLSRIGISKTPHKVTVSGSQLSGACSYRHHIQVVCFLLVQLIPLDQGNVPLSLLLVNFSLER